MDIATFWDAARAKVGDQLPAEAPQAWSFGDSPEMADRLGKLVVSGAKTATASAQRQYDEAGEPLPQAGDLAIILDGRDRPMAVIRTAEVRVVPFNEVDAEHAQAEGEGDRTLEAWQEEHAHFFESNGGFDPAMPLVLERFEVLYK